MDAVSVLGTLGPRFHATALEFLSASSSASLKPSSGPMINVILFVLMDVQSN